MLPQRNRLRPAWRIEAVGYFAVEPAGFVDLSLGEEELLCLGVSLFAEIVHLQSIGIVPRDGLHGRLRVATFAKYIHQFGEPPVGLVIGQRYDVVLHSRVGRRFVVVEANTLDTKCASLARLQFNETFGRDVEVAIHERSTLINTAWNSNGLAGLWARGWTRKWRELREHRHSGKRCRHADDERFLTLILEQQMPTLFVGRDELGIQIAGFAGCKEIDWISWLWRRGAAGAVKRAGGCNR
jgi:hypothetical protein